MNVTFTEEEIRLAQSQVLDFLENLEVSEKVKKINRISFRAFMYKLNKNKKR